MGKITIADKLRYLLVDPHFPDVGIEFNSDAIRLAVVSTEKGAVQVQHLDLEPLPEGAIEITPFKPNILHLEPVAEALKALWSRNKFKSQRVCLLLQDRSALTFHVALEHQAGNPGECLDLIRFKLKKSVPFRIEDANVTYFDAFGVANYTALNLWTVVLNPQLLHQYEDFLQSSIDVECGLVDLSTLNLLNLADSEIRRSGQSQEDLIYVNLNRDYISIAITQKSQLMFYRSRVLEKQNGVLEEALGEVHPTAMYYADKLGGQNLARAFIYAAVNADVLAERVQDALQVPAYILSVEPFSGTRFDTSNPSLLRGYAPLVGLLASRKVEYR